MSNDNIIQEFQVKMMKPSDYKNRSGYNHLFLETKIPLPSLTPKLLKDCVLLIDDENYELKYSNFSVVMSKSRGLAFFTAVNIDGSQLVKLKRDKNVWYFDPRINKIYQYGPPLYSNNDFDRGHLVRRLDPVWGNYAKEANEDTFHFTNCAPQHKGLNQRTWLELEDYILENADLYDLKVSVFSGPVFTDNDMIYREKFKIPSEYWKIVIIIKKDGKVSSTGYIQTQKKLIENLKFVYGEFKTYQIPISTIENLTNLNLGNLSNFDPLNNQMVTKKIGGNIINIENNNDMIL